MVPTDSEEWWLYLLFYNLLGYATVLVPGGLLIYILKRYKRNYEGRSLCIQKCIRMCVEGEEPPPSKPNLLELGEATSDINKSHPRTPLQETTLLVFCFCGLQFSYLTWGILQEKIMTKDYVDYHGNPHKFSDSQFLVFVNRVLAFAFSGAYLLLVPLIFQHAQQPRHNAPLYKYSYCSFSNIMSSWCQYEALKYISFPTQVLAKTSKIIPVMLMGKIVSKKTFSSYEYATAATISVGMTVFFLSKTSTNDMVDHQQTTLSGVVILIGYMVFDSFTSNWQSQLFSVYKMSSVQMMCGVNLFSCLLTSVSLLQQGGFQRSISFSVLCPTFFFDCFALSICSALGQLFIFYTISQFGPVVFVIIMTVRQAVAILLSWLIFGHYINLLGFCGIALVFLAVFLRIYLKKKGFK